MNNNNKEDTIMSKEFNICLVEGHDTTKGLEKLEAAYIQHVYELAKWNQSRAAAMLDISRGCLRTKLKTYFGDKYL